MSGLGSMIGGIAGEALGGPVGAVAGTLLGGATGGSASALTGAVPSLLGGLNNAALSGAESVSNAEQTENLIDNMEFNTQMMWQQTAFNQMTQAQSQQMQEVDSLRDVAMQQRKADDSITKEFISSIKS